MQARESEDHAKALVQRAHKGKIFSRKARGFSYGELAKAGVEPVIARRMGLPVDRRRRTVYDFNVDMINRATLSQPVMGKPKLGRTNREEAARGAEMVEAVEAAE